ncbi:MAG: SOS response-associated peptidase family protein, partial [Ilumatobacteraceae bacterium]
LADQHTFTMITRESVEDLSHIHNRCLVEFSAKEAIDWLAEPQAPLELFDPAIQPRLATLRVSTRVNSVMNNDPSLVEADNSDVVTGTPSQDTLF